MGNKCPCVIMSSQVWYAFEEELETARMQHHEENVQMIKLNNDVISLRNQINRMRKTNPQDP